MYDTSLSDRPAICPFWASMFGLSPGLAFVFATVIGLLMVYLQQSVLLSETLYFNSLGEQMAHDRIEALLQRQERMQWIAYSLVPIALLLQIFVITLCLNVGAILYEYQLGFSKLFGMVTRAMVLLSVVSTIQVIPLLLVPIEHLDDLASLDWFSVAAIFQDMELPFWLLVPLKMLNIFFLVTVLILAGGMHWLTGRPYGKMLGFVAGTYGVGMLLLVLLLVFLQLNMS